MDKMKHHHPPEPYHIYKLFIQCEIIGGKMMSGVETNEVRFFSINALPNLSLERNTIQQLLDIYQLAIQSDHAVIFD
ncbi:hypothetical protein [Terrilactibacillus laevilacticus]|uniref:Uncharacterized protein n=1 Tax=Terrilactibacillus laevilacticus TaxID=1380157 RepID=A0ABW5PPG5_9BACI|nr:hypothetical protein [Terrilactibacillus laevilacticus]